MAFHPPKGHLHKRNKAKEKNIVLEEEVRDTEAMFPTQNCHLGGWWTEEGSNQWEYFVTM